MKKEDLIFQDYTVRLGGAKWDLRTHTENGLYSYITFTSGAFPDHGVGTEERCYYDDELYRVYKFDWEIQNGWLYLYYSDGYTFIIEYPSVSGRYFYGTAEDGFEIRLEWVDGRSIRKKVS